MNTGLKKLFVFKNSCSLWFPDFFRFYRDLSGLEGFDFAFGTGGYYYHTSMDRLSNIQPGSIQHYGVSEVGGVAVYFNRTTAV